VYEVFGLQMKKYLLSQLQLIFKMIGFILKQERKKQVLATIFIRECEHFSRGIMASVGVSRMGKISMVAFLFNLKRK